MVVLSVLLVGILSVRRVLSVAVENHSSALRFIEENVNGILKQGEFPEFFGLTSMRIEDIGCKNSPKKLTFGLKNGYSCVREVGSQMPREDALAACMDMFSLNIAIICPPNWVADCGRGCLPPEISTTAGRMDFWELAISEIIKTGYHYSAPTPDFITKCGCEKPSVRLIEYGSGVGFDCILRRGWQDTFDRNQCWNGHHNCQNEGRDILTFCPIGYIPTCAGCIPGVPGLNVDREGNIDDSDTENKTIEDQLGWLVDILAGYARQSQIYLGWMPSPHRTLACACKEALRPVEYGMSVGYWCPIWDAQAVKSESCGTNIVCMNPDGDYLLHMCPDGFVASCEHGCSFPWTSKHDEL